ncbi:MAG: hypothetical protein PHF11_03355, partial [Candidatus Omnitrophica bacterium]|nr:hypothetical protein [Candidatus Omnitrophota bacterium]
MEMFDFGIGWPVPGEENDFFVSAIKSECQARKLKFIFIDEKSIGTLSSRVKKGEFRLKFYLDMASETFDSKDDFIKFAYHLKDSGTRVVADPDDVKAAADKSIPHF